ncbi:MAG: phage shock protein C [Parcubacteria group bacterium Gr01-1014_46]|nr:MAG: phage shock protein C [Parcubacteria group bacterium Gr01-1014_46]
MVKILYKSEENKIVAGVIGGLGEYYDVDPTILRLAYIIITIATGVFPAVVGYIIAVLIVPKKPITVHMHHTEKKTEKKEKKEEPNTEEPKTEELDLE